MKDLERIAKELQRSGAESELSALASSRDGQKLSAMLDKSTLERAQSGDTEALRDLASRILSTDEGRRLAENVQKLMKK